jgi:pyruvate dehydrogenase (quinone)
MSLTVSEFIVERLHAWGVRRIFGFPGDGINGVFGALSRATDKIDFIQTRHEEAAAFMACGHAKFTGEVGVCIATSGPGAIHLLNGLYDAKMDHQPVVALVGQQARSAIGGAYQQEVDLISLFKDVAHEFVHMCTEPSQIRHLVDRAFRIAMARKSVTCIILPNDVQELKYEEPARKHGTLHSGIGYSASRLIPYDTELKMAADLLNDGNKVAMLVGAGALHATDEILEVAELLGAGIAKALLGKAAVPDDVPFVTGSIGLLGTKPSWDLMTECDTLLMVGSSFPYSEFLPKEGQAKAVQIDIEGKMLSIRYPMNVQLVGDSKDTLQALIPLLKRKNDRSWQKQIIDEVERWWKVMDARAHKSADPINPQYFFWELSKRLPDNCIISADSGSVASWFARDIKIRKGMMASLSGNLATMCPGVPYTIAAKFAHPDRMAIGFIGDGAFQMLGMNEMITIAKYWKRWKDPRLLIVVLKNHDLNQVTWEQRVMEGDAKFSGSQDVPDFQYAQYAKMLGLEGIDIEKPEDIPDAIDRAMQADRPIILEVASDPSVPPMPPHISIQQAKAFMSSMIDGDVDTWDMIKQTYKSVVAEYFPEK